VRNKYLKSVDLSLSSQSILATGGTVATAQNYTLKEVSDALVNYFENGGKASDLATAAQNNYGISAPTLAVAAETIAATTPAGEANTAATIAANAATTSATRQVAIRDYITGAMGIYSGADLARDIYRQAILVGTTQAEIAAAIGWTPTAVKDFFAGAGIPQFAAGTNYTNEGLAYLHEGEAVVPKAYNPSAGGGGVDTAKLEALIERLTAEVAELKSASKSTAASTSKLASQFDTATEGGRAILTEAYA